MTSVAINSGAAALRAGRLAHARAVAPLALVEAKRLLVHPAYLTLIGLLLLRFGLGATEGSAMLARGSIADTLEFLLIFVPLMSLVPASLVASSAQRANAEETLNALPLTARARTLALCLGSFGPAAIAAAGVFAYWLVVYRAGPMLEHAVPIEALAPVPLLFIGGSTLAVATARWVRVPGAIIAVIVSLLVWTIAFGNTPIGAWLCPWVVAYAEADNPLAASGSHLWHAVYLLGLSGLATVTALLHHPGGRRPLLVAGAVVAVLTAVAGWVQLP